MLGSGRGGGGEGPPRSIKTSAPKKQLIYRRPIKSSCSFFKIAIAAAAVDIPCMMYRDFSRFSAAGEQAAAAFSREDRLGEILATWQEYLCPTL